MAESTIHLVSEGCGDGGSVVHVGRLHVRIPRGREWRIAIGAERNGRVAVQSV